jgi:hypothetical protein
LERFGSHGEQYFHRQFDEKFDFFSFNQALAIPYIGNRRAIAFDPSFIHKSGKHTAGIGYVWSGCAGKVKKGLEILGLSVIDTDSRLSFHLQAIQTPPGNCLQNHKLTLPQWYGIVIEKYITQIHEISSYVVADAFFSKKGFVDKMRELGLHLVFKLRDNADLQYLNKEEKTGKRGRPARYAGKVKIDNLDKNYFKIVPNQRRITAFSAIVYSKSLKMNILVVVEELIINGKITRRLLFSTNINQSPEDVIDMYHTCFQMEFGFRDAKQFTGLENSQARLGEKLDFHFNAALTTVNIAKIMQLKDKNLRELPFSMRTYKVLLHNALLLSRFSTKFAISANSSKNQKLFNELLYFGIAAA